VGAVLVALPAFRRYLGPPAVGPDSDAAAPDSDAAAPVRSAVGKGADA
jgi:hypothetical protein